MSNDNTQITPFDGYGSDAGDFAHAGALARPMMGPQPGMGPEPGPAQVGLAKRLHASLRGRYWIGILLGSILGAVGGYFGYRSQHPVYRAEATVRIIQFKPGGVSGIAGSMASAYIPNFEELLQSEAMIMISRKIVGEAIRGPNWKETKLPSEPNDGPMLAKLAKDLSAEHPSRSEIIRAYYIDRDPGVAAAVIQAITKAYETQRRTSQGQDERARLDALSKRRSTLYGQIAALDVKIHEASLLYGTDKLDTLYENKAQEVSNIERRLNETKLLLNNVRQKKDAKQAVVNMTPSQIAMMDQIMRNMIMERDKLEAEIRQLAAGNLGSEHTQVKQRRALLEAQNEKIDKYAAEWRDLQMRLPDDPVGGHGMPRLLPLSEKVVESEMQALQTMFNQLNEQLLTIGRKSLEIQDFKTQKEQLQKEVFDTSRVIDVALIDIQLSDRLQIVSYGEVPVAPYKDRRKMFGAAGALGGFGLPIALLAFIGLMDKRYRYSDEASEGGASNVPLLGILPRLPDKLTDPEQAAVAAHCIHQIRIMLQVGADPERRRVFMITSASTGDGKTSLCMALGLSFAASGSKTLLIDCDMVGQGLTHRLKAHDVPGLVETLSLGTLRGHVRKTATKGLYLLPIGNADAVHAGALSPQSINRLLAACREHFDVIVIDTGPILGSLEASVVAAEADGVIMAVARGQKQPLVEKAIKHLRSIGARIFGIVFNRAEQRDFQRSVPSASIRSLSARPVERPLLLESDETSRFGPLANSVASCMPGESRNNGNGNGEI